MVSMKEFIGRWKLVHSENFEEYLKEIGVGLLIRKAASLTSPTLEIKLDGDTWHFNQYSTFKNNKLAFKIREKFVEIAPDERSYNTLVTFENGKFISHQDKIKENHHSSVFTTWLENGKLLQTYQSGSVICRREFVKE
ncbi:Fatty acid-binding protein homolog 8 [Caenorhabditis elegans]|uniref:Fatty acid-binding protein homolog 8 n=2 Tax=Caenorhabditis elegans TaxID=6239 RepID=FABP8_CAEEL|nr:Fatty acid-binding protein homolog 8 [Caenorhabditis elegans]O02324.2 RecName: Full=Fatty acid-binding protein homolog 8 [Caenorhabditis elegans]CAB03391.2 Fatty acid-binding protein homolog 8 [Caenorhabditis elegans]|eukprot:NP_506444.2 Lipid Binding Protein [Caenorhabditis elegans]